MTRYETAADRAREARVAAALGRAWQVEMRPTGENCGYDLIAFRAVGVIEIKCQLTRSPEDYDGTLFLDVHKRDALLAGAADLCVDSAKHVWAFPGEARWIEARDVDGRPAVTIGRRDRGNPADIHPTIRVRLDETGRVRL